MPPATHEYLRMIKSPSDMFARPSSARNITKCVIAPGNGCTDIREALWYSWVAKKLKQTGLFPDGVIACTFPDPVNARESIWIPFMADKLGVDSRTLLIGHSSGAEAAMRFAERRPVGAIVLVSACWTDLGNPHESLAGYYSRPWLWDEIRSNVVAGWICQFGSDDDPFIPRHEMMHVHQNLKSHLVWHTDRGHYADDTFPDLIEEVIRFMTMPKAEAQTDMFAPT